MVSGHAKIDISMLQDTSGSRLKCTVCGEEFEGATAADANRLFAEHVPSERFKVNFNITGATTQARFDSVSALDKLRETYPSIPQAEHVGANGFRFETLDNAGKGILKLEFTLVVDTVDVVDAINAAMRTNKFRP